TKSVDVVILDTGAFQKLDTLIELADKLYTSHAYLSDASRSIQSSTVRQQLQCIQPRIPSNESLLIIKEFTKKTGDYNKLTELDFILMAIMYDVEKERIGVDHINQTPLLDRSRYFEHTNELREVGVNVCSEPCVYFSLPGGCSRGNGCYYRHPGDIDRRPDVRYRSTRESDLTNRLSDNDEIDVFPPLQEPQGTSHVNGGSGSLLVDGPCEEVSEEGWVDSELLSSFDVNVPVDTTIPIKDHVMCCTDNQTIQSVLLQMGFQLLSLDLKPITKLRVWTRKCSICFKVCKDESRAFCPFCGNRSLKRVQAVITNRGIVGIGDFIPLEVQKKRKRKQ
ncbi:hypothetical protein WA171_003164, partial [Blastocystis sp. BT1]